MKEKHPNKRTPLHPERLGRSPESMDRSLESLGSAWKTLTTGPELRETPTHFVLTARLPGFERKDVRLDATATTLTLRAQRRAAEEPSRRHAKSRVLSCQSLERTFSLPAAVRAAEGKASLREGVLTVELPKLKETKVQQVRID